MIDDDNADIAIVGLACRFPGAHDAAEFWRNLAGGVESITRLSDEEILASGVPQAHLAAPHYVKAAAVLDEPGGFDAAFFGFVPSEARTMDPQHRILLELAATALEDAGCDPTRFPGRVGVFTGSAMNTYFMHAGLDRNFAQDYIPTLIVNDKDFLSTRISYKLNLKGPSLTVQTACSTSLVAVHLARQSLLSEETDVALAGAISVRVPHRAGYFADGGGVSSPDGRVRAFDAEANGTLFGSGGGVVVLKRLRDAVADGDSIRAIIKGSAVNNDGAEKAGYTAPSVNSQADAIVEALANADVEADSISYIEAHGSGTPVGDPIEVRALTKAFRSSTQRSGFCAIGSVKTNIGHLDAAAGMAGLIKTVLALQHRQIPASLNYSQPNPEIDFPSTPFFVNTRLTPWFPAHGPCRAGIMSTGMGGTNAHVVIEEAPAAAVIPNSGEPSLFILSARTESALATSANRLGEFLGANPSVNLEDAAFTLQTGRRAMPHRRFVVGSEHAAVIASLAAAPKRLSSGCVRDGERRPLVLLLPGVGDHYVGMGRELHARFPAFRREVDRCAGILQPLLGLDIREVLYPKNRDWNATAGKQGIDLKKMLAGNTQPPEDEDTRRLNAAVHVQPALFTIEYALACLWKELGAAPQAIVGHSMGEYVAACLAGVFSLEDALRLVVRRTQLVDSLPAARMLAVPLPEAEVKTLVTGDVSISLINGPNLCVVAGSPAAVEELAQTLTSRGVITRPVQNTHAFHSRMLDSIVPAFAAEVRKIRLKAPAIPFISNVTGRWITAAEATDPDYWGRHTNHTARFHDALQTLWQMDDPILLEAGPGRTLGVLAQQHPARPSTAVSGAVASLRHHYEGQPDAEVLLTGIGRLWLSGVEVHWEKLHGERARRKIPLPTYPYERQNYWLEAVPAAVVMPATTGTIHKNPDPRTWFSAPSWKRLLAKPLSVEELAGRRDDQRSWLFFLDELGVASALVDRLIAAGHTVATVRAGHAFHIAGTYDFTIDPCRDDDYGRLIDALPDGASRSWGIVHAWSITGNAPSVPETEAFEEAQTLGFQSLLYLAQALGKHGFNESIRLFVLSDRLQDVQGREDLRPEKSTVLGPCLVIPQEFPNVIAKNIDLEVPETEQIDETTVARIAGEFYIADSEMCIAYRNGQRWVQTYEPTELPEPGTFRPTFREGGVYLITGGLGNVGREIAQYLAKSYRARIILTGRVVLPAREAWTTWIETHPEDDPITRRIQHVVEIEKLGGVVCYLPANADDRDAMETVLGEAERQFGALHGVVHGAGVVGDEGYGEIREITKDRGDLHLQSKARGLMILDSLLKDRELDFRLSMSSLASVLGGIGQAAYAAANIFLDTFARRRTQAGEGRWLSVNWDVWRIQENVWGHTGPGKTLEELGMTRDEAMQVLETALTVKGGGQIVVSTGSLDARIRQWIKLESLRAGKPVRSSRAESEKDSGKQGESMAEGDEVEQLVAQAWKDVLGVEKIGLNESFFDLGGHSLLALQIVARIRTAYRVDMTLRDFFEAPTISQSSAIIRDKLIQDIAHLTDEEVRELIASTAGQHD